MPASRISDKTHTMAKPDYTLAHVSGQVTCHARTHAAHAADAAHTVNKPLKMYCSSTRGVSRSSPRDSHKELRWWCQNVPACPQRTFAPCSTSGSGLAKGTSCGTHHVAKQLITRWMLGIQCSQVCNTVTPLRRNACVVRYRQQANGTHRVRNCVLPNRPDVPYVHRVLQAKFE